MKTINLAKTMYALIFFQSVCSLAAISEIEQPILIQFHQGQNVYQSFDHYFHNYELIEVSSLTRQGDNRNYYICDLGKTENSSLQIKQKLAIFESTNKESIEVDFKSTLKMDEIITTHLDRKNQVIYLLSSNWVRVVRIKKGRLEQNSIQGMKLPTQVSQGQFTQVMTNGSVYLTTEKSFFEVIFYEKESNLVLIEFQQPKWYTWKSDYLTAYYINSKNGWHEIHLVTKKSYQFIAIYNTVHPYSNTNNTQVLISGFETDIKNGFYLDYRSSQQSHHYVLLLDEQYFYITLYDRLRNYQSVKSQFFSKLPQTLKCAKAKKWSSFLFFQCKNYLLYINVADVWTCKTQQYYYWQPSRLNNVCIQSLKFKRVNVTYDIQDIDFIAYRNTEIIQNNTNDRLLIKGADRYEVRSIQTEIDEQTEPSLITIISFTTINTYFPGVGINQVYTLTPSVTLIVSTNQLLMYTRSQQKKEIVCKTYDESAHKSLNYPSGDYNGTLAVQGVCNDLVSQGYQVVVVDKNLCRIRVPFLVKIHEDQLETMWFLLLLLLILPIAGVVAYCYIKKRRANQQENYVEKQAQKKQKVQQSTLVAIKNQEKVIANDKNEEIMMQNIDQSVNAEIPNN